MKNRRLVIAIIAVAMMALLGTIAHGGPNVGTKAPNFTLPALSGNNITLSDYFKKPGKVVVLDIWATWCPRCRVEMPYLVSLNKEYKDKDVVIIGVALDEKTETVKKYVKDQKIDFTVAVDPLAEKLGKNYKIQYIPATYVIDRNGVIRYSHSGFSGKDEADKIEKEIKTLLAEK